MGPAQWIVILVACQRLAELALSRRNQKRLIAQGAYEVGARHYPLIVLLHAAWLLALFFEVPADAPVSPGFFGLFILLQGLRVWVIVSLGQFWTTRIITLPGAQPVKRGPYRWLRHPNYLIVAAEIAVLPLAFGAGGIAGIFSFANGLLLAWRARIENRLSDGGRLAPNRH